MKQRKINNLNLSSIGLGCMGLSEFYGETNDKKSLEVLQAAYDLGINFFDTADMYGYGENEKIVGQAIKPFRDEITLATKFGIVRDKNDPTKRELCGTAEYAKSCCEASLKRLGVDVIDLYYLHRVDPNTPIEETVSAMADLFKEGKIKYLGLSEVSLDQLKRAHAIHPISAVQTEYSMMTRNVEKSGVLEFCKENNIAFVPYSPLCRALLSDTFTSIDALDKEDFRRHLPRFQGDNLKHNQKFIAGLKTIAADKKISLPQLALAWLLHQGEHIVPIPGTKRLKYLKENIAATEVVFNDAELSELRALLDNFEAKGLRYTEDAFKTYNFED